jgi:ketosteroid isomerase-like protein
MSEESTTPDLVELMRQATEPGNRRDFDAVMSIYALDAVWDGSHTALGSFEGATAIRGFFEDWVGADEEYEQEIAESRDLGNGVVFTVVRFDGRPAGSTGRVQEVWSWTGIWVAGMLVRVVVRSDIDAARAAAKRLAEERG